MLVGEQRVSPRQVFHALFEPKVTFPGDRDWVLIRVKAVGEKDGRPAQAALDLMDAYDEATEFTAMERATGFGAAVVLEMAVRGETPRGAAGLETCVPPSAYVAELRRRGMQNSGKDRILTMPTTYQIAFWNMENLFDVENSPRRTDKLQRAIGKDLRGWDQLKLDTKVKQLAAIIRQINGGRGPDMMGVCEIENAHVLQLLAQALSPLGRHYEVEHHDMSDGRGIDVAFLYDANLFRVEAQFSHFVMRRNATRDILQVNFRTRQNRLFVAVGNHWPSRSGGHFQSDGYRAIAGETLAYFHERILEVHGATTPVLAMGDFNDEPFDRSLTDYAQSTRNRTKVIRGVTPRFLNLMWPLMGQGLGSFWFDNDPNLLDQFLANENLLKSDSSLPRPIGKRRDLAFSGNGRARVVPEAPAVRRDGQAGGPSGVQRPLSGGNPGGGNRLIDPARRAQRG